MKNWKSSMLLAAVLVLTWTAHAAHGQSPQPQTNSVKSSPSSDTVATNSRTIVNACMATAVELEKTRVLVSALETETAAIKERLATEKRTTALLTELNETRKNETEALKTTVAAKNETIAAKDAVITSQDKLIEELKHKKSSPWRRIGDILLGAGVFAILK